MTGERILILNIEACLIFFINKSEIPDLQKQKKQPEGCFLLNM